MKCHACERESLIFVKVEMFTIYPQEDRREWEEQRLCLPCFHDNVEYIRDCEGRKKGVS